MRELFERSDLVVTAAGQTVAEAASSALPAVIFQTAENQAINIDGWTSRGAAMAVTLEGLLSGDDRGVIERALEYDSRRNMVEADLSLEVWNSTRRLATTLWDALM